MRPIPLFTANLCSMVFLLLALNAAALAQQPPTSPAPLPVPVPGLAIIEMDYTNEQLDPAHWQLKLHADGSGEFSAQAGPAPAGQVSGGDAHRSFQLSQPFTDQIFATARERKFFAFPCESHYKVAFQGHKQLSYSGPDGSGSCEYNYSKDKEIQALGDQLLAVENTLIYGVRLEKLLVHDRLGLDREMDGLVTACHDKSALEMGAIRDTLTRLSQDESVLERVRKRARLLLAQAP